MISNALQRNFLLGEEKYIDFRITSHKEQVVVIESADWVLTQGEQIVSSGACEVDGPYISALINPPETGVYMLEIRYTVPPETRKVKVVIHVN